jgi:hypothetical protein
VILPILVEGRDKEEQSTNEAVRSFDGYASDYSGVAGSLCCFRPIAILPADAGSAVLGFDKAGLRRLEHGFLERKLEKRELADIISVSKLVDGARLKDKERYREYLAFSRLAKGLRNKDPFRIANASFEQAPPFPSSAANSLFTFGEIGHELSKCRLIFWWRYVGQRSCGPPRVGVLAPDPITAVKIQIVLALEEPTGIAYCESCGRAYIRTKHGQRFCDLRCGNRERQARCRANKEKKGASNGKRAGRSVQA